MYSDESSRSHIWVCVDGRALVAGGMGSDLLPRSILQQYDLRKDVWALLPPMPTPRYDANTHLLANKLYVAGIGSHVFGCIGSTLISICVLNNRNHVKHFQFVLMNSEFIISSGGRHCKRPVKAFEVYDTETRSWTTLPMMPCKRSYGGVIWDANERLCLLGGLRQGGGHQSSKFTKNVNIFDSNQGMETYFPLSVLHRLSCFLFCSADSVENM